MSSDISEKSNANVNRLMTNLIYQNPGGPKSRKDIHEIKSIMAKGNYP